MGISAVAGIVGIVSSLVSIGGALGIFGGEQEASAAKPPESKTQAQDPQKGKQRSLLGKDRSGTVLAGAQTTGAGDTTKPSTSGI